MLTSRVVDVILLNLLNYIFTPFILKALFLNNTLRKFR